MTKSMQFYCDLVARDALPYFSSLWLADRKYTPITLLLSLKIFLPLIFKPTSFFPVLYKPRFWFQFNSEKFVAKLRINSEVGWEMMSWDFCYLFILTRRMHIILLRTGMFTQNRLTRYNALFCMEILPNLCIYLFDFTPSCRFHLLKVLRYLLSVASVATRAVSTDWRSVRISDKIPVSFYI